MPTGLLFPICEYACKGARTAHGFQTVLSSHCPQGFKSCRPGQDPEICIFDKHAGRPDARWSWTTLWESEVSIVQAECRPQAHWSGWMQRTRPVRARAVLPSGQQEKQLGRTWTTQSCAKAGCTGEMEQQPPLLLQIQKSQAINSSSTILYIPCPRFLDELIELKSFPSAHSIYRGSTLRMTSTLLCDLFPPYLVYYLNLHVLESAGLFSLSVDFFCTLQGNSFIANDSRGRNIWELAISFIELVFLSWPLLLIAVINWEKLTRKGGGPYSGHLQDSRIAVACCLGIDARIWARCVLVLMSFKDFSSMKGSKIEFIKK